MKIIVNRPEEIEILFLEIIAAVRYDEEEMPKDFPGRNLDVWNIWIDIDTRKVLWWPQGRAEEIHLTVKDNGTYILYGDGYKAASLEGYVPHGVVPGSYGDTIEMSIASDGTVTNLPKNLDFSEFFK